MALSAEEVADAAEARAAGCRASVLVARRVMVAQARGLLAALQDLEVRFFEDRLPTATAQMSQNASGALCPFIVKTAAV